jgi:transcription termination factor Rho
LAIERAKRLVEAGKHVFILLDSITRTARAFNNAMGGGGRTMSGGIDARAMEIPRKIFAAARNTEEAGSLTIVATALIETGSRMDELIFQEFKGTGNMEMVLDRKISDQRIYPAIDIFLSGTRREELLLQPWELEKINLIRRGLAGHKPEEAIQRLLMFVKKFPTNAEMLKGIPGCSVRRRLPVSTLPRLSRRNVLLVECVNRLARIEIIATENVDFLIAKTDGKLSLFVWIAWQR